MTVSAASKRDLESIFRIPEERIDVVSEAASQPFSRLSAPSRAQSARACHGISEGVPLFLTVGGLSPHKNVLALLRSFEVLLGEHPEVELAIVGDTSGEGFYDNVAELRSFVGERPRLRRQVRFTGYLPDDDLVALYNDATALVFPSLWEGFGLPAIEAMACGLPVLASDRGSLPEVIGTAGLFFDPNSREEMTAAMNRLLCDGSLHSDLSRRALERTAEFTWDRGAQLVEESFRRCLRIGPEPQCAPS
jgi:glycosyltransferase involved in cell wall biosynthesis